MILKLPELESVTLPSGKRFYTTPDGNVYPSVTTILGTESKEGIDAWKERVGQDKAKTILKRASFRGSALHDLAEKYLLGEKIDLQKVNPIVKTYFKPIRKFLDTKIGEVLYLESALYSDILKVAGRVDCVATIDGVLHIIDFKTAFNPKKEEYILGYKMQASTYAYMLKERTGLSATRFCIVIAVENYPEPQIFYGRPVDYIQQFVKLRKAYTDEPKADYSSSST